MAETDVQEKLKSGDICRKFGFVKNTLYDWERKGIIPPAERDWRKHRYYTEKHVNAIRMFMGGTEAWKDEFKDAVERVTPDIEELKQKHQLLSVSKISSGNQIGFEELRHYDDLTPVAMSALVKEAQMHNPESDEFKLSILLVAGQLNRTR